MNDWNRFISPRDKALFDTLGYDANAGYGKRPALIIIDANYAFCGEKSLPITEAIKHSRTSCGDYAWNAIAVMEPMIKSARKAGVPVIYTTNEFRDDGWDMGSWRFKSRDTGSRPVAPQRLHKGNEIVAPLTPAPGDIVVKKQKPSGFFGTQLAAHLNLLGCDSLLVAGGSTSGCVRATVVDAFSLNYRVTVASDATFDRFETSHALALFDMQCRYADIVLGKDIEDYLVSVTATYDLPSVR